MLEVWNLLSVGLFDVLLGWLLEFPRWIGLLVVGLMTAVLLTLIRKWTTNQDRLRRAAADLRRLKELRRAAKDARDVDAVERCNVTKAQISWLKLKAEGWPLLAVLLPVALLATWAFERLAYYPPRDDETIEVVAYLPRSAQDDLMHLVPQPRLRSANGWVQPVRRITNEPTRWDRIWATATFSQAATPEADDVAIWRLQADAAREPYPLVFRWKEHTFERELRVGQRIYSPVVTVDTVEPITTEVRLRETRLFGIPGLGAWLPAWLVGYLVVTIPVVFALKKVLAIY